MRTLRPAEHRLLAVGLLAAVLFALYLGVIGPLFVTPQLALGDQMAELRDTAQRYDALLTQRAVLQQRSAQLTLAQQRDPLLMPGSDPAQVSADLVDRLGAMIAARAGTGAGCQANDKTPIAGEADGTAFQRVKVSLGMTCAIEPLAGLLADIEHAKPYLFVDALTIARGDDAPATGPAGRLHVQMTVTAYMHAPRPQGGGTATSEGIR